MIPGLNYNGLNHPMHQPAPGWGFPWIKRAC